MAVVSCQYFSYKFSPMLVNRKMNGSERASPNFLLDTVLIYSMNCNAVVLAIGVFGSCM